MLCLFLCIDQPVDLINNPILKFFPVQVNKLRHVILNNAEAPETIMDVSDQLKSYSDRLQSWTAMTPLINAREVSVGLRSVKHKGNNTTSRSGSLLRVMWGPAPEETTILTQEEIFSNQETQKQSCVWV